MVNYNMVYALSDASDQVYKAFSPEAWAKAVQVSVQGMATIFIVLALMWGVLGIFKLVFANKKQKADKKASVVAVDNKADDVAAQEETVETDDTELIAIITAAVAAYRAAESDGASDNGFRVVSFKRASQNRSWNSNK